MRTVRTIIQMRLFLDDSNDRKGGSLKNKKRNHNSQLKQLKMLDVSTYSQDDVPRGGGLCQR